VTVPRAKESGISLSTLESASRALGLVQSLAQPLEGTGLTEGAISVATEVFELLATIRDDVFAEVCRP
jgi:hypothetical protein